MSFADSRKIQYISEEESDTLAQTKQLGKYLEWTSKGMMEAPHIKNLLLSSYSGVLQIMTSIMGNPPRSSLYFEWLKELTPEELSLIGLRESIRMLTRSEDSVSVVALSTVVGKGVVLEVTYKHLKVSSPVFAKRVASRVQQKAYSDLDRIIVFIKPTLINHYGDLTHSPILTMDSKEFAQIGKFIVNALWEAELLESVKGTRAAHPRVRLPNKVMEYLFNYDRSDVANIIDKQDTAMVCVPDQWKGAIGGGYLTDKRKMLYTLLPTRKMRRSNMDEVLSEFTPQRMPRVFKHANWIQSIPMSIHEQTKEAIVQGWKLDANCMGLPRRTVPPEPKFPFEESWVKKEATEVELESYRSWAYAISNYRSTTIKEWKVRNRIISEFTRSSRKQEAIWYPVFYDFRGRMYYRGKPNIQGEDIEKAVIHFHDKKPLGKRGLYWLKVAIANDYGFDKATYDERVKWTEDHIGDIRRAIKEPWDYPEVWGDSPFCMYSSSVELINALDSGCPEGYATGIPVRVDATCSGHQHFAALFRDPVAASLVNLKYRGSGGKSDIYTFIANAAMEKIKEDLNSEDEKTRHLAEFALKAGISRSMAKRPIMTQVYSATLHSAQEYVGDGLKDVLAEKEMDYPVEYSPMVYRAYIARKLFDSLEVAVPSAVHGMAWLKECSKEACTDTGLVWTTPTGFRVHHDYQLYKDTRVKLNVLGVNLVTVRAYGEGVSKVRATNAVSPNFVHSLDATHLLMTGERMRKKGLQMQCIHDSFGTHACDVDVLQQELREAFVELYSMPIAERFKEEIGATIEAPGRGSLDIREVLDSPYFFC